MLRAGRLGLTGTEIYIAVWAVGSILVALRLSCLARGRGKDYNKMETQKLSRLMGL